MRCAEIGVRPRFRVRAALLNRPNTETTPRHNGGARVAAVRLTRSSGGVVGAGQNGAPRVAKLPRAIKIAVAAPPDASPKPKLTDVVGSVKKYVKPVKPERAPRQGALAVRVDKSPTGSPVMRVTRRTLPA